MPIKYPKIPTVTPLANIIVVHALVKPVHAMHVSDVVGNNWMCHHRLSLPCRPIVVKCFCFACVLHIQCLMALSNCENVIANGVNKNKS